MQNIIRYYIKHLNEKINSLVYSLLLSKATLFGILGATWSVVAGPITVMLIARKFSSDVQGYYYTFSSLVAANIFFELGLSNVIKYFASHEWSSLSLDSLGDIVGDSGSLSRLLSLGRQAFRWYSLGGVIFVTIAAPFGFIFFSQSIKSDISWTFQWMSLSILVGFNMVLIPVWALLEGCGQVNQVYLIRMFGAIVVSISAWVSIYSGAKLWTAPISYACQLFFSISYLIFRYKNFLLKFTLNPNGRCVDWFGEIWCVQWRTAVGYICGYFTTSIFTPILFHYHGPVVAGQFGMSWSLALALISVSTMWSTPRGPQFAVMIAKRNFKQLDNLYSRIMLITILIMISSVVVTWLIVYIMNSYKLSLSQRLLSPLPMGLLMLGLAVGHILHPAAIYLRAYKKEPFFIYSTLSAFIIGTSCFFVGSKCGVLGLTSAYLVSNILLLPVGYYIFTRCRREWQN